MWVNGIVACALALQPKVRGGSRDWPTSPEEAEIQGLIDSVASADDETSQ